MRASLGADTILIVFADDWGRHPSSCQHLIGRLLERHDVYWVNTIGTRTPRLDLATVRRGLEKARHWLRPKRGAERLPPRLRVVNPRMWPWLGSPVHRSLNRALLLRQLGPMVESLPGPPVAITTVPVVADLMGRLRVARWVYYCVDDFSEWPGLDQITMRTMERRLVERADVVIAVSEVLKEKLAVRGRGVQLLSHGVDLRHWGDADGIGPVPELDGLERPLIVFWGVVDRRLDLAFLDRLGRDLQSGTIVLIGPTSDPSPALSDVCRLVCTRTIPYGRLPAVAKESAVLIMPYADLPVTCAMQPLKLKEYLATGTPVVVRELPATRSWSDCLDLVCSPEAFSAAVRARLKTGVPLDQRAARRRLVDEDWTSKAACFEQWIME